MVEKLIRNSRTTEVYAVSLLIAAAFDSAGLTGNARLNAIMARLKELIIKLNLAINHIKVPSDLQEMDKARIAAVRSFYHLVSGFKLSSVSTVNTAANTVLAIFNHYGLSMVGKNYGTETALICSLLIDLSTIEILACIDLLPGVNDSFSQLQIAQTAFEKSNLAYEKSKAEEAQTNNASELKIQVVDVINNMLIHELYTISGLAEEGFDSFIEVVDQLITDNNIKVKKRFPNKDEESDEQESDEQESDEQEDNNEQLEE